MRQKKEFRIIIDLFISPKVSLGLFVILACTLVPTTFSPEISTVMAKPVQIILFLIALNLATCTFFHLNSLKAGTLAIHLGVLIILLGGLINSQGFVATVNIYEGDSVNQAFRWDTQEDMELGFNLRVSGISLDYYPVAVKIGVLKNDRKEDLVVTRTGDSFVVGKYRMQVASLNPHTKDLMIKIQSLTGSPVGTIYTTGQRDIPEDFPLDFKLVAYQTPDIKRVWANLEVIKTGELLMSGASEVNHPLRWQGLQFFLTKVTTDNFNRSYAGIQVSKAPGIPYVYFGFALLCLGLLLSLGSWLKKMQFQKK